MATTDAPKVLLPGPRAFPLLGWRANLLKLFRDPFTYLPELHHKYGKWSEPILPDTGGSQLPATDREAASNSAGGIYPKLE